MKANKSGFGKTNLQIEDLILYPEISEAIQQTLGRLLAYDNNAEQFKLLVCDTDGRLLVSTSATQAPTANHSQVSVGIASINLVAANAARRSLYIQNLGANPIYLGYGVTASLATGFQVPSGGTFIEDRFTGVINAIASVAGNDVRLLEI